MRKKFLLIISILLVTITTYAYSALSTQLAITSDVKMRPLADIRVNGIVIDSASGATMQYESEYTKNTISSGFILPTTSARISYSVHIDNTGDYDYAIYDLTNTSTNNSGLQVNITSGYIMRDVIPAKTSLDVIVTYNTTTPSANPINVISFFNFKKVYHVSYVTGTSQTIAEQLKYEDVDLALSNTEPTKNGYTFTKWNTKQDGTGVNYLKGATYTPNEAATLYAQFSVNNISLANQTLNNGTYGTAYTSNAFSEATNGTGNYTYTIQSGAPTGATINSTNRTISFPATTPAGTYKVVVKATDSTISKNTTGTMTITINPKALTLTAGSTSRKYNGQPLTNSTCTAGTGQLLSGHTATCTMTSGSTITNAGSVANTISTYTIKDGNNNDVTSNYNVTTQTGTLTVTKADATCTINSTPTLTYPGAKTGNITYTCTGDGTRSVTSSDTTVITVGTVGTTSTPLTAKKVGSSTISVSQAAGSNYNAASAKTSTVTVTGTIYTITLDRQGGSSDTTTIYEKYSTGYYTNSGCTTQMTTSANPITVPSRTGYTFGGYYTSENGAGTQYIAANGKLTSSASTTNFSGNGTLYAKWTANSYTVTANSNNGTIASTTGWTGTGNTATKSVTYNATYGTLPTVSRSGYTFQGWSLLPEGYTQVEYIQSSGTQYIDTGYYWTHENIEIDFDGTVITNAADQSLFGNEEYTAASGNARNFAGIPHGKNGAYSIFLGNSSYGSVATGSLGTRFNLNILTTANKNLLVGLNGENKLSVTYNGTVMSRSGAYTSSSTSTTVGNIFIFANHNSARGSSDAAIQNVSAMRLYAFKMYDNGTLVRDFIPCINDSTGKAGLYDLVSGTFYGNRGTGNFTAGSASYITSSTVVKETRNHTIYAVWKDETHPVIVSATPSSSIDLRNYVEFNATDSGSGIVGYNITTTDAAPTTWIPVVDIVGTTTETKYEYDAAWARVFHHNNHWGSNGVWFTNATEAQSITNNNDKYSVLGTIDDYKNSSNWELMLQYPGVSATQYNRWTQTLTPLTTAGTAVGYTSIHTDWATQNFAGIAKSASKQTFIDGSPTVNSWYYAIGTYSAYRDGMPGSDDVSGTLPVGAVNLWSRIDNLTTTTSNNLTRRIGDIKEDGTYYVWVKDASGNTASEEVTISNTDTTLPTATITSTNNVATSQTVTLTLGDNKALDKYNWGTSNPYSTNLSYTAISNNPTSFAPTKTVSSNGTYYVSVVDKAGNRYYTSKVFYKTTLNANGGSVSPASVVTMNGNSFAIPSPTKAGYTFDGWYTNDTLTTPVTLTSGKYKPTSNATIYAKYTANALTFNDQTLNSGTYGTAYTSNAFTGASNGTNSYTYTIVSGAPTGATINSTNRTISFTNSTLPGTYSVVVRATDDNSGATKDATMTITVAKRSVTLTAGTASRAWNGSALTNGTCTAGTGQLISGHTVTCAMTDASTITTEGSIANTINTYTIKDGSNNDVTSRYNVTTQTGTLTITKATPTVSLSAKSAGYTGQPIAANTATASPDAGGAKTYTYYNGTTCSGTALSGAPTNVGEYSVKAKVAGVATKTNDAYSACTLHTITKVAATLTCSNKEYNGTEQTGCTCSGGTIGGDYKATNYSSTGYTATCTGDDNHSSPASQSWSITKKAVTITAGSDSRAYTATALTNSTCTGNALVSGHSVTCAMTSGSTITNVGSVANTINTYTIKDGSNNNVTANYDVTTATGTLTVTQTTTTTSLSNIIKTYNGTNQAASGASAKLANGTAISGAAFTYKYYTNSTCTAGETTTAPKDAGASGANATYYVKAILTGTTNYATSNKCATYTMQSATPTVSLSAKSAAQRIYTGSPIAANSASVTLQNSETYSGTPTYTYYSGTGCSGTALSGAPTTVGEYSVKATTAAFQNYKAGASSCVNHTITQKAPTLTVSSSKALTYPTAATLDYTYDGDGTVSCESMDTTYVTCSVNTSTKKLTLTPVKPTSSAVTVKLKATAGTNYSAATDQTVSVTVGKGTLTATATAYSAAYDGSVHYAKIKVTKSDWDGKTIVSGETTSYGQSVTTNGAYNTDYNLKPGYTDYTNGAKTVYYKITGGTYYNDLTGSTTVTISKRNVTLTAGSTSRAYNGSALTNSTCTAGSGQLLSGHTATCTMTSGSTITNAGSVTNTISTYTILDANSNDVTANYNVTTATGTLTINKADATCTINTTPTLTYPGAKTGNVTYTCTGDGARSVTSSDTTVITVGTVGTTSTPLTAKKVGSSTISVSQAAGTNYNAASAVSSTVNVTGTIYTITLDEQLGSGGTTTIYEKYSTGYYTNSGCTTQMTTSANPITVPTRVGYTFGGYYTSTNGGGTQYIGTDGKLTSSASTTNFTANGTLYAHWTANTSTVTANANGGTIASTTGWTGTGNTATKSVTYNNAYGTLPTVTRSGYTFQGWSLEQQEDELPAGYTQVEYIQSSGTQYINLNYTLHKEQKAMVRLEFTNNGNQAIFGTFSGNYIETFGLSGQSKWEYRDAKSGWVSSSTTAVVDTLYDVELYYGSSNQYLKVNGTTVIESTAAHTTNVSSVPAFLLSRNSSGSQSYSAKAKLYSFKLYDGDTLVRDMVPCINDSTDKAGMYDLVEGVFYGNEGTGDFTAGEFTYITSETLVSKNEDHTIYAKWTTNELTFNNQTLSSGTYGTAYTSGAFTGASSGTGSYTYTIVSGAPTGATINSTNRTISFTNSTLPGTYSVVVRATDNGSSKTKDATMTITIAKRNVTLTAGSTSRAYNGSALTNSTCTAGSGQLVTGHTATCTMTSGSTVTNVADSPKTNTISTYTIKDANNNDVTANYTVTTATGTLTLTKATCPTPTGLSIATNKKVSWTNNSIVSSYQISMSASSGFAAHTNNTAYNAITEATGTRTVYLRSVCDTANFTSANSSNASASTTVYSVSLTAGTGISAVSGAGNYITGASASIDATVKTGYTWTNWTGTSTITTKSTSVTVNGTKTYTANATANSYTVTANANGGSIASTTGWTGTGNTATKSVTYNAAYGTLPTVAREGYTLAGWSLVPDGYTQIEYIESTNTQYINTGAQIFNKASHEIIMDFEPTQFYNYNQLFGSTTDGDTFESWIYSTGSLAGRYNTVKYGSDNTLTVNTRYLVDFVKNDTKLSKYVNGTLIGTGTANTSTATGTMTLFKSGSDYSRFKLYSAKIYANGEIVRDFVPCINNSTGKAGLYDVVNGVFYGNDATSGNDFTVGSAEYITSSTVVNEARNHTIYAKWEGIRYYVAFDGNGNTSGTMANQEFKYGQAQNLTSNGYAKSYTVTYAANGGSVSPTSANTTATYTFGGWLMNGEGSIIANGASVNNLTTDADVVIPFEAQWKGDGNVVGATKSITTPTPTRTGATFIGWKLTADDGLAEDEDLPNVIYPAGATIPMESNITLTAQWEDQTAPSAPSATVTSGTLVNGVYKSAVTVKVTAGTDSGTGVLKTTYQLNSGTETQIANNGTFNISTDGTYVITVRTYDKAKDIPNNTWVAREENNVTESTITIVVKQLNELNYSFNTMSNLNNWNFYEEEAFDISYDELEQLNEIRFENQSGWEIIYIPIDTVASKSYKLRFDYLNLQAYTAASGYSGIGIQALTQLTPEGDNTANAIKTEYLPTVVSSGVQTKEFTFTATGTKTYIALNFGMISSNAKIRIGNFRFTEKLAYNASITNSPQFTSAQRKSSGLPEGYTEMDYLEGTGTSYLETGVKFNPTTDKFEVDYQVSDSLGNYFILGGGYNDTNNLYLYSTGQYGKLALYNKDTGGTNREIYGFAGPDASRHNVIYSDKKLYVDGVQTADGSSYTFGETPYTIILFDSYDNKGTFGNWRSQAKIYSYKMWKSGVLTRYMVPCINESTGKAGMYDLVTKSFATNVGDFYLDPEKIQLPSGYRHVKYIESTGTQWIDTGYKPKTTTNIETRYKLVNSSTTYDTVYGQVGLGEGASFEIRRLEPGTAGYRCKVGGDIVNIWMSLRNWNTVKFVQGTGFYVNGTLASSAQITATVNSAQQGKNIYIMRGYYGYSQMRMEYFTISEGDTLIRQYIPAVQESTGKAGFYDLVTNTFYGNAGTGEFLYQDFETNDYTYNGWYDEPSGGTILPNPATMPANDTTYYAQFEGNKYYNVTYDSNYVRGDIYGQNSVNTSKYLGTGTAISGKTVTFNQNAKEHLQVELTMGSGSSNGAYFNTSGLTLTADKVYTWSVFLKADSPKTLTIGSEQNGKKTVNVTTEWQRFTYTFTANSNSTKNFVFYLANGSTWTAGEKLYIHSLEIGQVGNVYGGAKWNNENNVKFDGSNDYVNLGLNNIQRGTIEVTFSMDAFPSSNYVDALANTEAGGLEVMINSSKKIQPSMHIAGSYRTYTSAFTATTGVKYTVTGTYDGTTLKYYLNGQPVYTLAVSGNITTPSNYTIWMVGAQPYALTPESGYMNGKVYSARSYDRALTPDEVRKNYEVTNGYTNEGYTTDGLFLNFNPQNNIGDSIPKKVTTKQSLTKISSLPVSPGSNLFNNDAVASGATISRNGNVYTLTQTGSYQGMYIPADTFTEGHKYLLTYNVQKTSGTIYSIGGFISGSTEHQFLIDGGKSRGPYYSDSYTEVVNDTSKHKIDFMFTYHKDNSNNNIYIQLNRGNSTAVTAMVSDIGIYDITDLDSNVAVEDIPVRPGYTFQGWYTQPVGGKEVTTDNRVSAKNTIYYAQWVANTTSRDSAKVTFVRNTTAEDNEQTSSTYVTGISGQTFSTNSWSKIGHSLVGWSTNRNATTAEYAPEYVLTDSWITSHKDQTVTLYAVWGIETYTITLNGNGATSNGTGTIYSTYNTAIYLDSAKTKVMTTNANAITKPVRGYTVDYATSGTSCSSQTVYYKFNGFYTATSGGVQMINSSGYITSNFTPENITQNTTLYAQWTSSSITLPSTSKTGYNFKGWKCNGTTYSAGSTFTPTGYSYMDAQWSAKSYKITFYQNAPGAQNATSTRTLYYGNSLPTIWSSARSTTGSTNSFQYWRTSSSGGTKKTKVDGTTKLYAYYGF